MAGPGFIDRHPRLVPGVWLGLAGSAAALLFSRRPEGLLDALGLLAGPGIAAMLVGALCGPWFVRRSPWWRVVLTGALIPVASLVLYLVGLMGYEWIVHLFQSPSRISRFGGDLAEFVRGVGLLAYFALAEFGWGLVAVGVAATVTLRAMSAVGGKP